MSRERPISEGEDDRVMTDPNAIVRTYLWYVWAEIAVDNERLALTARGAIEAEGRQVDLVETEMKTCLVAITAAGHSLDSLQLALVELGQVPEDKLKRWRERGPKQQAKVAATLNLTFSEGRFGAALERNLDWLYGLRNTAVHNQAPEGSIVFHPVFGTRTTPARVRYSVENASRAVEILLGILRTATTQSEVDAPATQEWSRSWRPGVSEIAGRRVGTSARGWAHRFDGSD